MIHDAHLFTAVLARSTRAAASRGYGPVRRRLHPSKMSPTSSLQCGMSSLPRFDFTRRLINSFCRSSLNVHRALPSDVNLQAVLLFKLVAHRV